MNGTKDGRTVTGMVFIVIFISFRNSTWLLVAIDSDRKVSSVHLSVHPCVINFHIFNLFFWANSCPVTRLSTMFLFLKRINIKIAGLAIDWPKHFQLLLQNYYRWSHQTYQTCSSRGLQEVLLLFRAIRNPTLPLWPLISLDIFLLFLFPKQLHMKSPDFPEMFL